MADPGRDLTWLQEDGTVHPWEEYLWMVVAGGILSFAVAWGIGANDVANAFGTTVGAKTITLRQACLIAAVFELTGAIGLGGAVTKTVAGNITAPVNFAAVPEVFAFGMLCSLMSAWCWITFATYLELAVSTTHSIIGAIMGFGLVYGGGGAIVWSVKTAEFPYVQGLMPVVVSWFVSPILAATAAAALFLVNRTFILRKEDSHERAFWALPPLVLFTIWVNTFFVLYKGANSELETWSARKCMWVSIAAAAACTTLAVPVMFFLRYRHHKELERFSSSTNQVPEIAKTSKDWAVETPNETLWSKICAKVFYGMTVDVHEDVYKDERVAAMHSAAEVFDPRAEEVYKYLQVFSSCCVSFAHGANDVANAIGPFAAIWHVYKNHTITNDDVDVPKWILVIGGVGLVAGLATYGYNIIKALGVKMAKITPSRGYSAELGTAFTVGFASMAGLPVSTTHCIVGAEVGVGMIEGIQTGANWRLFAKTACAWLVTLVVTGLLSAALFAFGTHTPSLSTLKQRDVYENALLAATSRALNTMNQTNMANRATIQRFDAPLDAELQLLRGNLSLLNTQGIERQQGVIQVYNKTISLYLAHSIPTVGFNRSAAKNTSTSMVIPVDNVP